MPSKLHLPFAVAAASTFALLVAGVAHADPVIIWQNGFESADTCAWAATEPTATCDPEMVFVPAGTFTMGNPVPVGAQPVHNVNLSAFWIDRNDVTVDAYAACVTAGGCTPIASYSGDPACNFAAPPTGDNPVKCADWHQGLAYCTWAGKRYPTEAEWEKAARSTDARTYPWGEVTPTCDYAVVFDLNVGGPGCGLSSTWPVGSKPAGQSPYGALDMAGNVWQWVNDWYDPSYYSVSPATDPSGPATGSRRVLRGGSFRTFNDIGVGSSVRGDADPSARASTYGFRCARDAE